jgi:hypothetical protein
MRLIVQPHEDEDDDDDDYFFVLCRTLCPSKAEMYLQHETV